MKKIPTLFKREFENHKVVKILPVFTNAECAKAVMFGSATVKYDGSCCALFDGVFYKRYDAKKSKPIPENAIKCQEEADPVTGHLPCWVPVDESNPADKWFIDAYRNTSPNGLPDHTYEAIGPHFQGNPYGLECDILRCHGMTFCDDFSISPLPYYSLNEAAQMFAEDYLEYIRGYLTSHEIEGIVFWYDGAPVCKIKRTDFGLPWPVK